MSAAGEVTGGDGGDGGDDGDDGDDGDGGGSNLMGRKAVFA